jgi:hypothetical protein
MSTIFLTFVFTSIDHYKQGIHYTSTFIYQILFYRHLPAVIHRVFSGQADWTLPHTSYKGTDQRTTETSITLNGVTLD